MFISTAAGLIMGLTTFGYTNICPQEHP